jgi:hypothetical protein
MIKKKNQDIDMTFSGDFIIDEEKGDLRTATSENHRTAKNLILRRIASSPGDFLHSKMIGAGLNKFLGLPNTPELGSLIKATIVSELTRDNLFPAQSIDVRVFPMSKHSVVVFLQVSSPTLSPGPFSILFSYDMRDNRIIPRRF